MKRRANIAVLTGIFAFAAVITVNLFKLMVVDAKIYQNKADENQFGSKTLPAARGSIYTADGKILAQSATAYQIMIDPKTFINNDLDNPSIIAYYIHTKLGVKKSDAAEAVRKNKIMDFLDALPETYNLSEVRSKFNGRTVKEINKVLFSEFLAGALKIDASVVREAMEEKESRCVYLAQKAEKPVKDKIQDYIVENGISCMDLTPNPKRYYPQDDLASSVVGFLDYEGNGQYGIERQYDEYLSGVDGVIITAQDAHDEQMPYRYSKLYEAKDGNSVNLTVDSMIQYYCETSLDKYIESSQAAEYGCAIVMNAKTGAVLGMYSAPGFDINNKGVLSEADQALLDSDSTMITATELPVIGEKGEIEKITEADLLERVWKNKAISVINEPGSVFKVFTSAAAFEEKVASFEDKYVCNGFEMINNSRINCHKEYGHGEQDFKKALLNSCNPAFMQIGLKLGGEKFSYYADAFGLREPTGIDLPGEADSAFLSGSVLRNNDFDLAESAFGQANCLTPIQIITGYTAAINGGYLLRPHIVGSIVDSDMNEVIRVEPEIRRQVISEQTSALVREALQNNVDAAETGNAKINGYKIGGKSGTAEKESKKASEGYKYDRLLEKSAEAVKIYPAPSLQHVASYCAFAPADDPEIVVYVAVDEPQQGSVYGGVIAAPCVREIMEKTLPYMGYYPEYTDEEVLTMDKRVPDVDELSTDEAVNQIKEAGFTPVLRGEGDSIISQSPSFTSSMPAGSKVFLYTDHVAEPKVIMMPDLTNMKIAEVTELFESLGLNLKANGSRSDEAIVLSQSVEARSSVTEGAIVQVLFGVNSQTG